MIAEVEGEISSWGKNWVIVKVNGISLQLYTPSSLTGGLKAGEHIKLFTYLQMREDGIFLYGFSSPEEKELFQMVMGVSGIGPKTALSILSHLSPQELGSAIVKGDPVLLSELSGLGEKMSHRLILELKEKVSRRWALAEDNFEVMAALTSLGYSSAEAARVVALLPSSPLTLEERVRIALQHLAASKASA
jgi:Holliday junction DNA helicase RuvA